MLQLAHHLTGLPQNHKNQEKSEKNQKKKGDFLKIVRKSQEILFKHALYKKLYHY